MMNNTNYQCIGLSDKERERLDEIMRKDEPKNVKTLYAIIEEECEKNNLFQNCVVMIDQKEKAFMIQRVTGWRGW